MKAHRIRLAGPWEAQLLNDESQPVGGMLDSRLPYSMFPSPEQTGVRLQRGFHRPTGIDPNSVLRIILKANQKPHEVRINSTPAEVRTASDDGTTNLNDTHGEFSIDITHSIAAFNQLSVIFQAGSSEMPATLETAWLEIQD
jgi:hypothetical protein